MPDSSRAKSDSGGSGVGKTLAAALAGNRWLLLTAFLASAAFFAPLVARDFRQPGVGLDSAFASRALWHFLVIFLPALALAVAQARGWWQVLAWAAICAPLTAWWLFREHPWQDAAGMASRNGEVPVPEARRAGVFLVALGMLSPIFVAVAWRFLSVLDRYLLRKFLAPFALCLAAFFAIWLIFDLNDNLPDFREGRISLARILSFYGWQVPLIFTKIVPAALLISLVFALGRMSRANEFIGILGSGQGLWRTLLPLFGAGLYMTFVFFVCHYEAAPWAEGKSESLLDEFSGDQRSALAERRLFLREDEGRSWYIGQIPFRLEEERLRVVDVHLLDPKWRLRQAIQADEADWDWRTRTWHFLRATIFDYPADGGPPTRRSLQDYAVNAWTETPWELTSDSLQADYLGVPQLLSYIRTVARDRQAAAPAFLTQLHDRFAAPWVCLAVVFVAAPLGIAFSRRGVRGGVASAILLFGLLLFSSQAALGFGKAGLLSPALAAWFANVVFLALGLGLLYFRSQHKTFRLRPQKLPQT